MELLVDVFPQPEEFPVPDYSPIWACAKPVEFDEIGNKLDEIAWSGLITSVISSTSEFDAQYDKMLADLEGSGMSEAEAMLTEIVTEMVSLSE